LACAFVGIHRLMAGNDHRAARRLWSRVEALVSLLFCEANPMPVKYCLWRQSLLRSPECRLPLTGISRDLATTLDCALAALHEIPTLTDATLG
jgi:4-hydroxy-tetrahydrodipicolinate synthase